MSERDITFALTIRAPGHEVWSVLTNAQQMPALWEKPHEVHLTKPEPAGIYRIGYEGGDPADCEIIEIDLGKRLRFRLKGRAPEPTTIEYVLEAVDDGTHVRVLDRGYKAGARWDTAFDENFAGWLQMFLGIRKMLEVAQS